MFTIYCHVNSVLFSLQLLSYRSFKYICCTNKLSLSRITTSATWDYFRKDGEYAVCLVPGCKAKMKHSSYTKKLLKHLHSCHIKEYEQCIIERQTTSKMTKSTSAQITIQESVSLSRKYPRDSSWCKKLDDVYVFWQETRFKKLAFVDHSAL